MKPYIFGERSGMLHSRPQADHHGGRLRIHVHQEHLRTWRQGLFVGTKKQAQDAVKASAERANMPYITSVGSGGMLTNFVTIRSV